LNTSLPGVELPLLDGKEAVAGMVVPDFDIILPEVSTDTNDSTNLTDLTNITLRNITFGPGDENGSPTWRLGGLCALVVFAAAQWTSTLECLSSRRTSHARVPQQAPRSAAHCFRLHSGPATLAGRSRASCGSGGTAPPAIHGC